MPVPLIIALVFMIVITLGGLFLVFFLIFRSAKSNSDFVKNALQIKVGMDAQDAFRIMDTRAATIEEDRDRIIIVWKQQQWIHGTLLLRSLKIVVAESEKIVSVVGENLDRSAWI